MKDVFALEELQLSGQEALMVVVMEYCDLGELSYVLFVFFRMLGEACSQGCCSCFAQHACPCSHCCHCCCSSWGSMLSSLLSLAQHISFLPAPALTGSLRKALQRKAFRPSAKWPFQTTYVSGWQLGSWAGWEPWTAWC